MAAQGVLGEIGGGEIAERGGRGRGEPGRVGLRAMPEPLDQQPLSVGRVGGPGAFAKLVPAHRIGDVIPVAAPIDSSLASHAHAPPDTIALSRRKVKSSARALAAGRRVVSRAHIQPREGEACPAGMPRASTSRPALSREAVAVEGYRPP